MKPLRTWWHVLNRPWPSWVVALLIVLLLASCIACYLMGGMQ